MRIDTSVAIITGGASGLGLATATELLAAGARVVVVDLPSDGALAAVAALRSSAQFCPADVTDPEALAAAVDTATRLGPLRIAVSCAGIATPGRIVGKDGPLPLSAFDRVVQVNLIGTFNLLRLAAAAMSGNDPVDGERGVIVCTSSIAAFEGQVGQAAYAASKGAVASLTLPAARELASSLVRVMSIAPGLFETPMLAGLPEQALVSLAGTVPHPSRLGLPQEYAGLVRHIVENPMLNGSVIRLDGALRMAPR